MVFPLSRYSFDTKNGTIPHPGQNNATKQFLRKNRAPGETGGPTCSGASTVMPLLVVVKGIGFQLLNIPRSRCFASGFRLFHPVDCAKQEMRRGHAGCVATDVGAFSELSSMINVYVHIPCV